MTKSEQTWVSASQCLMCCVASRSHVPVIASAAQQYMVLAHEADGLPGSKYALSVEGLNFLK